VRSTTVLEIPTAEQEALLRELRQARYGHLLAIHILLLYAAGKSPTEIADFLFCSRSSVYRSVKAYRAARLDWQRDDQSSPRLSRWQKMLRSLIKLSPRVLGWCRVRWSCAALSVTLAVLAQINVSRETVRLELKATGYVWKRAKLKGRDDDPERARRLARIRLLFENQRPDELILFADELDIDLLPKVGYQWMLKGTQLEIRTPGKNQKHYLAAALNPATGQNYYVLGPKKKTTSSSASCWIIFSRTSGNAIARFMSSATITRFIKRRRLTVGWKSIPVSNWFGCRAIARGLIRSSAFSATFTTNAHATILGGVCEPWSGTWKNIWRKTARRSTGCQRSTTLQKWIWKWMYYGSELLLGSKSSVPILVAPI